MGVYAMGMTMTMGSVGVTVVMSPVRVTVIMTSMGMTMVSMAKCGDANKVDYKPKCADRQKLANALHLTSFDQPLNRFVDDFDADEPRACELYISTFSHFALTLKISHWQILPRCPLSHNRRGIAELAAICS